MVAWHDGEGAVIRALGLDLAWSPRNPTGVAVIAGDESGGTLIYNGIRQSDAELTAFVAEYGGVGGVLVAIDAPTLVPNETGLRPGERDLNAVYRQYDAGAHPSNRQRLTSFGGGKVRGEVIVALLEQQAIRHHPYLTTRTAARQSFEVYPHPATVALFGLSRTLKYKAKPGRDYPSRYAAFGQLEAHLLSLAIAEPALIIPVATFASDLTSLKGAKLKDYEDRLDAILCAYVAFYYWYWGPQRVTVFGDTESGHIVVPHLSRLG